MKFQVTNRWSGDVQFTADITCGKDETTSVKLGLAVKWAKENGANLDGANLYGANLTRANLDGANLDGANLTRANLDGANLDGANLTCANLYGANLYGANLDGANLDGANLDGANLTRANLTRANLDGADLTRANLYGATLPSSPEGTLAICRTRILPPEGEIIGWKKCRNGVLVKLRVPTDAARSHAFGRKCRAQFVDVLEVIGASVGISQHDGHTEYTPGTRVTCDTWCSDWREECAGGIHFYITREEATAH